MGLLNPFGVVTTIAHFSLSFSLFFSDDFELKKKRLVKDYAQPKTTCLSIQITGMVCFLSKRFVPPLSFSFIFSLSLSFLSSQHFFPFTGFFCAQMKHPMSCAKPRAFSKRLPPKNMRHKDLQNANAFGLTGYCNGGGMSVLMSGKRSTTTDLGRSIGET